MAELRKKIKQPLSLRWKWGILLFVIATLLNIVLMAVLYTYSTSNTKNALEIELSQNTDSVVNYLETTRYPIVPYESFDMSSTGLRQLSEQQEFLSALNYLDMDKYGYFLYSNSGDLVFQTKENQLDEVSLEDNIQMMLVNGEPTLGGQSNLSSSVTGSEIGHIVVTINPQIYDAALNSENRMYLFAAIIMIFVQLIASFLISHYFFRPLYYLTSALDRVEEDSLSDIRVLKPGSDDEWSDLSLHVNRLLDKIDLYVTNQKQFVEDVSHELRTPVAIVEGHLKMLTRWGKDDPEVLENSIDASLQEISRMKTLVQEMLDLSRADHVDVDYRDEMTEIYSVTKQVFHNFDMLHEDFEFYLDMDQTMNQPLYVRMYRNHFEQILIILLDNAVKYSKDRQEVHISVSESVTQVEIAIQDFGEGMTEEDKEKVFGRFYRIDKARSRDKGGNGLGLSIAKQLVTSYRGNIWVESVENEGSIFYINFPIIKDVEKIKKLKKIADEKDIF
ncbi:HAMP domain-containing histidine kinase [Aerococcaceae bacterium DSM 111176]|nr:HAMP domain-containing histidine kinase [Aerococcaceae bacterium DSM 111176]